MLFEKTKADIKKFFVMFGRDMIKTVYGTIEKEIEEAEKKISELEDQLDVATNHFPETIVRIAKENERLELMLKQAYESDGNKHNQAVELQTENEALKKQLETRGNNCTPEGFSNCVVCSDYHRLKIENEALKKQLEDFNGLENLRDWLKKLVSN
jgi:capsule polysaccharide export protein KpsE/RkpR